MILLGFLPCIILGKVKGELEKVIGYGQTAVLKNDFHTPDMQGTIGKALKVAQGTNKSPLQEWKELLKMCR